MKIRRTTMRSWFAILATLMLVLSSALGGISYGAGANPAKLDALGNPICSPSSIGTAHGDHQPAHHDGLPTCCLFGCHMGATAMAPPPDAVDLVPAWPGEAASAVLVAQVAAPTGVRLEQASPRAPPARA